MKSLLLVSLLAAPLLVSANTSLFNTTSNANLAYNSMLADASATNFANSSFASANENLIKTELYDANIVARTASNTVAEADIASLSSVKKYFSNIQNANVIAEPASLPLLLTAIVLFIFGSNRRRV